MQPLGIVERHNVLSNVSNGLSPVGIISLLNTLRLEIQEETLHHSIIPAVTFAAHTANPAMLI
jgi:hypothetical protein